MLPVQGVPHWTIEETRLGPVHIGMSIEEFKRVAGGTHFGIKPIVWFAIAGENGWKGFDLSRGKTRLMRTNMSGRR